MDLKVSDGELAYQVDMIRESARRLDGIVAEYGRAMRVLLATGIQSGRVSAALDDVPPRAAGACIALEEALSTLVPKTSQFIQDLDADDELLD
ncbi:MAG: hypothetical protein MR874_10790 [Coriobacteriaceae bacterium]|uniref:hypothetical protein n=1 Tax=Tractidigestivibacter sp. TaxID=2847320 RepID=UPI002A920179|nr:hypothetical protein [Tractidigestivibacter sp.]MCI6274326.1 hypothetical protein [Coriobacteriaceae bacterium]MCI6548237.1 hypothetical protein [Coriobacteriaceae bacterium]MCI6845221.1 hypothetical protein [Coriobacteriaceae bacterium]MCI7438886.1 hypothetical protein [Coriobacteriaceae bacterium]MDD7584523.1 hypothetical protein [Coriobacteriaceae bacterium]